METQLELKEVIKKLKELKARKLEFLGSTQKISERFANEGRSIDELKRYDDKEWAAGIQKLIDYILQRLDPIEHIIESKTFSMKTLKDMISCGNDSYAMKPEDVEIYMTTGIQEFERIADKLSKDDADLQKSPQKKTVNNWKPPKGFIGSKTITNEHNIPRTTLQGWAERDEKQSVKDPQTQENYYPKKWIEKRLKNYRPRQHDA